MHIQRQTLTPCHSWLAQRFHQNQLPMHIVWLLDEVLAHLIKIWPVLLVLLGKYFFQFEVFKVIGSAWSFGNNIFRYNVIDQNIYNKQSPQYSMLARRFVPGDKTKKPGPGAHYPENVSITKEKVPNYSMGIRHSEYITPFIWKFCTYSAPFAINKFHCKSILSLTGVYYIRYILL